MGNKIVRLLIGVVVIVLALGALALLKGGNDSSGVTAVPVTPDEDGLKGLKIN